MLPCSSFIQLLGSPAMDYDESIKAFLQQADQGQHDSPPESFLSEDFNGNLTGMDNGAFPVEMHQFNSQINRTLVDGPIATRPHPLNSGALRSSNPRHIALQNLASQTDFSPFSNFSTSPPLSPFSSPPASPLPAHFRNGTSSNGNGSPFPAHVVSQASNSSAGASLSGTKRRSSRGVDEKALAIRRRKHNELEIRRRKKMNEKYEELYTLLGCPHTRIGILDAAITRLRTTEAQIKSMNIVLEALKKNSSNWDSSKQQEDGILTDSKTQPDQAKIIESIHDSIRFIGMPCFLTAPNGSLLFCNRAMEKFLGFSADTLGKSSLFSLITESDLPEVFSFTKKSLSREVSSQQLDLHFVHAEGMVKGLTCLGVVVLPEVDLDSNKPIALLFLGKPIPMQSIPKEDDLSNENDWDDNFVS